MFNNIGYLHVKCEIINGVALVTSYGYTKALEDYIKHDMDIVFDSMKPIEFEDSDILISNPENKVIFNEVNRDSNFYKYNGVGVWESREKDIILNFKNINAGKIIYGYFKSKEKSIEITGRTSNVIIGPDALVLIGDDDIQDYFFNKYNTNQIIAVQFIEERYDNTEALVFIFGIKNDEAEVFDVNERQLMLMQRR